MSHRYAESLVSGCIDGPGGAQDLGSPIGIGQAGLLHQIHRAPQQLFELSLQIDQIEEAQVGVVCEHDQQIHVASFGEIVS